MKMSYNITNEKTLKQSSRKKPSRRSVYERQREEETLRNAVSQGHIKPLTVDFLSENAGINGSDLTTLTYLNMSSKQLSSLAAVEMCVSLRVCVLSRNYITEFDALVRCVNLWALDLHGNQIRKVPGSNFWSSLKQLQILLLHDNAISKLKTIHYLSFSPSLLILTLYDTPLCLKKNYRHHVVNGIWSLKALDWYVVSDEEIIEDAKMCEKFAAKQNNLKIEVSHSLTAEATMQDAVKQLEKIKAQVNKIQAKYSPVLIIQKAIRAYRIRKRFKYVMATREWAATTIQRFYRYHHYLRHKKDAKLSSPQSTVPAGSSSPIADTLTRYDPDSLSGSHEDHDTRESDEESVKTYRHTSYMQVPPNSDGRWSLGCELQNNASVPKYLSSVNIGVPIQNERISPRTPYIQVTTGSSPKSSPHQVSRLSEHEPQLKRTVSAASGLQTRVPEALSVTMDLVSPTAETIKSATYRGSSSGPTSSRLENSLALKRTPMSKSNSDDSKILIEQKKRDDSDEQLAVGFKRRLKPEMVGKYQTVRVFLGNVVQTKSKREIFTDVHEDETAGFQLHGQEPPMQLNDPTSEMLLSKKETGEDIRRSLRELCGKHGDKPEKLSGNASLSRGVRKLSESVQGQSGNAKKAFASAMEVSSSVSGFSVDIRKPTKDQRLFIRTHGTMGLACLRAVHQAYDDRTRSQRKAELNERVAEMKERRELGLERQRNMKQEYQESILRDRIRDGVKIADSLREHEQREHAERRKVSERRVAALDEERMRRSDAEFAREFVCLQNNISQALRFHDRLEAKKEKVRKLTDVVRKTRKNELEKRALVRKYMEHRRLKNKVEILKAKAETTAQLLSKANKHFFEVEDNMRRTRTRQSVEFRSVLPLNAPRPDSPLSVLNPAQLHHWRQSLQLENCGDVNFKSDEFTTDLYY